MRAPSGIRIGAAGPEDRADWLAMRCALWPEGDAASHGAEIDALLAAGPPLLCLIARDGNGGALGFAEASVRTDYVNGCETSPVGFLEGIFVRPEARGHGVARALVEAVADWARERGLSELASDALLHNTASHAMHGALGFEETERVVYFRMVLGEG